MTVVFYMNCVSAHQLPLAREVAKLVVRNQCLEGGESGFLYVDAGVGGQPMQTLKASDDLGVKVAKIDTEEAREAVETWDVVVTGLRDLELIERRESKGLRTFYYSERWFKPIEIRLKSFGLRFYLPGWIRMFIPSYRRMAKRFVRWSNTVSGARVLAIGPWAKKDFIRMGVPPGKIYPWGYFVEPGCEAPFKKSDSATLRLLWCGRLLDWKCVGDVVRAVVEHVGLKSKGMSLTIAGDGPERVRLVKIAQGFPITFMPSQPMGKIRELMRTHDTLVLASNACEGWGAVVNEALEEGMNVIGTYEAGASAAILPRERLYHAGDVNALALLLEKEYNNELPQCSIGEWTAKNAARRLMEMI